MSYHDFLTGVDISGVVIIDDKIQDHTAMNGLSISDRTPSV